MLLLTNTAQFLRILHRRCKQATGVLYEKRIRASEVSTSVIFEAIGVSCISAPFVVYIYYGIKKPPCRGLVCTLSTVHFSTLRQFLTNSKLLIWLTTHARQSTRHHSVFCLPLKSNLIKSF